MMIEACPSIAGAGALAADPGRPVTGPDVAIARSVPLLIEPPVLGDDIGEAALAYLAVSSDGAWKPVAVETVVAAEPPSMTSAVRKAKVGWADTVLSDGPSMVFDDLSDLVVRMVDPGQVLVNADNAALAIGANLAMVGRELIQFGRAAVVAPGMFRLTHLLRGRRGTEWASAGHAVGDPFCLIEAATLRAIAVPRGAVGSTLAAVAHGIADQAPLPRAALLVQGEAMRPPAPCRLIAERVGGAVQLTWTRRSHRGWRWGDGMDVPADAFAERYRVTLTGSGGQRTAETIERTMLVALAGVPAVAGQQLDVAVIMLGPFAASHPVSTTLVI